MNVMNDSTKTLYYITHSVDKLKTKYSVNSLKVIMTYVKNININIVMSRNADYNKYLYQLQSKYESVQNNIKCYEIENNKYIDFGKYQWSARHYTMTNNNEFENINKVYFMNDSVIVTGDISSFFKYNSYQLYGFLDSYVYNYHYQSYAFGISSECINIFISFIQKFVDKYACVNKECLYTEVINELEMRMYSYFNDNKLSTDCYIKVPDGIGFIYGSKKKYKALIKNGLYLVKYNVLSQHWKFTPPEFVNKQLRNQKEIIQKLL